MKRENERVAEDADRERMRAEALRLADVERKKLEQRTIQEHEVRERQKAEEAERARQEQAQRLLAVKDAEVQRARVEAESRARLELEHSRQEHEYRLAEIRRSVTRSSDRFAMIVSFVLLAVSTLGGLILYFTWLRPEWERRSADYEQRLVTLRAKSDESERKLLGESRRNADLAKELADLRSDKPASAAAPKAPPKHVTGPRLPSKAAKGGKSYCVEKADGDPLDGCIPMR